MGKELTNRINGFDIYYQYSDDPQVHRYWSREAKEIQTEINSLNEEQKQELKTNCKEENLRLFAL